MTVNGVIALILLYFIEFDSFASLLRHMVEDRPILSAEYRLLLLAKTDSLRYLSYLFQFLHAECSIFLVSLSLQVLFLFAFLVLVLMCVCVCVCVCDRQVRVGRWPLWLGDVRSCRSEQRYGPLDWTGQGLRASRRHRSTMPNLARFRDVTSFYTCF